MSKLTQHFITAALVLLVILLIGLNWKQFKSKTRGDTLIKNDLQFKLDSIESELQYTREQRDNLFSIIDSLHISRKTDSTLIVKKDKEIKSLKGKYNNIPQDSLGKLMNRRAGQ